MSMVMNNGPIDKFIVCACFGEGVRITYWPDEKNYYLSLWKYRRQGKCCWSQRWRHIWRILRTGEPWEDEIVLDESEAMKMAEFIFDKEKRNGTEKDQAK